MVKIIYIENSINFIVEHDTKKYWMKMSHIFLKKFEVREKCNLDSALQRPGYHK